MVDITRDANISPGMLSGIETGKIRPSLKTIHKISQVLDIPLGFFFQTDLTSFTFQAELGNNYVLAAFRQKMAEHRQRKKELRERVRRMLTESRSPVAGW